MAENLSKERVRRMIIGCFGFADQLDDIASSGFDTAELDLCEIVAMETKTFSKFARKAESSGLRFDVFSGLIPLSVRIHGEDFDRKYWLSHIDTAAERAAALGAHMIPFGAGKCRSIPEGCTDRETAEKKVFDFIGDICDIFARYSLELVIEPLGPSNSNFLNYVTETADFAVSLKRKNCHTMCDLRHMYKLGDSFDTIIDNRAEIRHAHIEYPCGDLRRFPQQDDGYDYQPYFDALYQSGYDRILTIEATFYKNFSEEAERSCQYLRDCALKTGFHLE